MKVSFVIPGVPQGKGRPRFSRRGNYVSTYTPEKTVNYEELVKLEYCRQCKNFNFGKDVPLYSCVIAYYNIPKRTSKANTKLMKDKIIRPTKKPDYDNIGKIINDALNGIAYHDDSQIVDGLVRKFYSDNPRVKVIIQTVQQCRTEDSHEQRN